MEAQHPDAFCQFLVGRGDQAAVAECEQVLGGEEAEGRGDSGGRDALGPERLRRVLDDRDAEPGQRVEVGRTAEQMHRHDRPRPLGHLGGDVLGIDVQRDRVDVGEDRCRAGAHDRLGRRVERERGADHLVAGADLERVQDEHERVGAVRDPDRPRHSQVDGRLLFEGLHVRSQDQRARLEHFLEPRENLRYQTRVLRPYVNERDRHREPV